MTTTELEKCITELEEAVTLKFIMKLTNRQYKKGGLDAITCLTDKQLSEVKENLDKGLIRRPFPSYCLLKHKYYYQCIKRRIKRLEATT